MLDARPFMEALVEEMRRMVREEFEPLHRRFDRLENKLRRLPQNDLNVRRREKVQPREVRVDDGYTNKYSFMFDKRTITPAPMTPKQVCENQVRIQQESEQKKESEIKKSDGRERDIENKEKESEAEEKESEGKNTSENQKESKKKKAGKNSGEKENEIENKKVDLYDAGEDLRTNLFQEEGNDTNQERSLKKQIQVPIEPDTRARAKEFKDAINGLIHEVRDMAYTWRPGLSSNQYEENLVTMIKVLEGPN